MLSNETINPNQQHPSLSLSLNLPRNIASPNFLSDRLQTIKNAVARTGYGAELTT